MTDLLSSFKQSMATELASGGVTNADDFSKKLLGSGLTTEEKAKTGPVLAGTTSLINDALAGVDWTKASDEDIISKLQSVSSQVEKEKLELALKMKSGTELSRPQMVAVGMISILPYLIGAAVKGKKGLALAAPASAIGGTGAIAGFKESAQKEKDVAALQYKDLQKQGEAANKMILETAKEGRERAQGMEDYGKKLDMKQARNMGGTPQTNNKFVTLEGQSLKDLSANKNAARAVYDIADWVEKTFPKEEFTSKGVKNYGLRKLAEMDPNSPAAELVSKLERVKMLLQAQQAGTQTEKDFLRIEAGLMGKAPATFIPQLIKNLRRFGDESLSTYNDRVDEIKKIESGTLGPLKREDLGAASQTPTPGQFTSLSGRKFVIAE